MLHVCMLWECNSLTITVRQGHLGWLVFHDMVFWLGLAWLGLGMAWHGMAFAGWMDSFIHSQIGSC